MILLAVNYHYIAASEKAYERRAIFPVRPDVLAKQLNTLGETFEFVSLDRLAAAVTDGAPLPEHGCVITFDDGLRCQYELAAPVLEHLDVPAIFFVPAQPVVEQRALAVHKLHAVRDHIPELDVLELLERTLGVGVVAAVDDDAAAAMYRYDTLEAARLKYLLNARLPILERERVISLLFEALGVSEATFCAELYMGQPEIVELARRGALGAHGYAHLPLGLVPVEAMRNDLALGAASLAQIVGAQPHALSYPYGSEEAVTHRVAKEAASLGFVFAFTMERAFNRTLREPLLLARVDANDAPGGSSPLFVGDQVLSQERMLPARSRYHREERT